MPLTIIDSYSATSNGPPGLYDIDALMTDSGADDLLLSFFASASGGGSVVVTKPTTNATYTTVDSGWFASFTWTIDRRLTIADEAQEEWTWTGTNTKTAHGFLIVEGADTTTPFRSFAETEVGSSGTGAHSAPDGQLFTIPATAAFAGDLHVIAVLKDSTSQNPGPWTPPTGYTTDISVTTNDRCQLYVGHKILTSGDISGGLTVPVGVDIPGTSINTTGMTASIVVAEPTSTPPPPPVTSTIGFQAGLHFDYNVDAVPTPPPAPPPLTAQTFTATGAIPSNVTTAYTDPTTDVQLQGFDFNGDAAYLFHIDNVTNAESPAREVASKASWLPGLGVRGVGPTYPASIANYADTTLNPVGRWSSQVDYRNGKSEKIVVTFPDDAYNISFEVAMLDPDEGLTTTGSTPNSTNRTRDETGKWTLYDSAVGGAVVAAGTFDFTNTTSVGGDARHRLVTVGTATPGRRLELEATGFDNNAITVDQHTHNLTSYPTPGFTPPSSGSEIEYYYNQSDFSLHKINFSVPT